MICNEPFIKPFAQSTMTPVPVRYLEKNKEKKSQPELCMDATQRRVVDVF